MVSLTLHRKNAKKANSGLMNDTVLCTISYSLPEALHGHIQMIVPTTYFGSSLMQGMKLRHGQRWGWVNS